MMQKFVLTLLFVLSLAGSISARSGEAGNAAEAAMVTAVGGQVSRVTPQGNSPLPAFARLKRGDLLALGSDARLQLVYFDGGRQEDWRDLGQGAGQSGRIEVAGRESLAWGLSAPELRQLPARVVRQIARTPSDAQGRSPRMRSIDTPDSLAQVEETYRRLRLEAARGDLNPELYLLSGLFEMREFDRIEQVVADLLFERPNDQQARMIVALYQKAVRNAREGHASRGFFCRSILSKNDFFQGVVFHE